MRILLAVDGSPTSDLAATVVASTRWPDGSTIRVISVLPRSPLAPLDWFIPARVSPDGEPGPEDRYRHAMERAETAIRGSGRHVDAVLLTGRPASAIAEEASDFQADVLVVGSRGHGPWESIVLGSVSAEVVDQAPCPVLVVRSPLLDPVILAHDDSPSAHRAEELLGRWPLPDGATVIVATVFEQPIPAAPMLSVGVGDELADWFAHDHEASQLRSRQIGLGAAERLSAAGIAATAEVAEGDPAAAIVAIADQHRAGLIVLGTRGHGGVARLLLGSVARNVLLHAHCSVLVVRLRAVPVDDDPAAPPIDRRLLAR